MATYAAYRHVELDKVGCGKRSIMKPPGGDCHDIFGADFHGTPSHHRVLKPPGGGTSSLFSSQPEDDQKSRTSRSVTDGVSIQSGVESEKNGNEPINADNTSQSSDVYRGDQNRSDLDPKPAQSSNLFGEVNSLGSAEVKRNRASNMSRNCVTGEGCQTTDHFVIRVHRQRDGNPVTGEGYDTPEQPPASTTRTRIPPGGYSSGLW